ncbi:MAG: hypothetical protein M1275_02365 [Patescibacteria group bacterium]|nr:hypothetical protein [Patescibacteria group bacterium]
MHVILVGIDFYPKIRLAQALDETGFITFTTFQFEGVLERLRADSRVSWIIFMDDQCYSLEGLRLLKNLHPHLRLMRIGFNGEESGVDSPEFDLTAHLEMSFAEEQPKGYPNVQPPCDLIAQLRAA